jgi:hypothetical protein
MRPWLDSSPWWVRIPEVFQQLLTPGVVALSLILSVLLFVASLLAVPWVVRRLPPDVLERQDMPALGSQQATFWRLTVRLGRNLVGAVLLLAGIAMLVLPGQGLLTIIAAIILLQVPGKWRLVRVVLGYAPVLRTVNRYRTRNGLEPLRLPMAPGSTSRDRP